MRRDAIIQFNNLLQRNPIFYIQNKQPLQQQTRKQSSSSSSSRRVVEQE